MQRWTNKPRQARKGAAVVGFTCAVGCLATFVAGYKVMPRDWDSAYKNDDTPWDKGYAAPPLAEFLEMLGCGKLDSKVIAGRTMSGTVLVPGCGTGHDVRALARQGAEVTGLDVAPGALDQAGRFPKAGSERYLRGDFLNLDETHHGIYDWVFEHTCLCAIDPSGREAYAGSLKQALKPGGYFLAVFFREVSNYTGDGPPHPISTEEIEALFGDDFEQLASFIPQQAYPSRPVGCEEVRWMRLRGMRDV